MGKKIVLRLFLVCFECGVEDGLEVGRGCGGGLRLRHSEGNAYELVSEMTVTQKDASAVTEAWEEWLDSASMSRMSGCHNL